MTEKEEQQAAAQAQLVKKAMAEMNTPANIERTRLIAMDRRVRYLAHIEAGFTEAQALELVKN